MIVCLGLKEYNGKMRFESTDKNDLGKSTDHFFDISVFKSWKKYCGDQIEAILVIVTHKPIANKS